MEDMSKAIEDVMDTKLFEMVWSVVLGTQQQQAFDRKTDLLKIDSYYMGSLRCHIYVTYDPYAVWSAFLALQNTPNVRNWCQG